MTQPTKPTVPEPPLRSQPDTFSERAEASLKFWSTFADYMDAIGTYTSDQAAAALAAALAGDLPALTGHANKGLFVNGAEDGLQFLDSIAFLTGTVASPNTLTSSDDLDTVSGYGFYTWSSQPTNAPFNYGAMIFTNDGAQDLQIVMGNTTGELAIRRKNSGTWPSFTNFINDGDIASQAQAEAGANDTTYMTPLKVKQAIGAFRFIKAFAFFDGTGTIAVGDSFNADGVTDLGVGTYRLDFTNDLANSDFLVLGSSGESTGLRQDIIVTGKTVSDCTVQVREINAGLVDKEFVSILVIGV